MPKLSTAPVVTTTETTEVKLAPRLRTLLLNEFRAYAALKVRLDAIKDEMDGRKERITDLREQTDAMTITIEGFTTTLVAPVRRKFNPKVFVAEGGDLAVYEAAMENVPSKPYEKITLPSDKGDSD